MYISRFYTRYNKFKIQQSKTANRHTLEWFIRHMFDVIDDKPEGVARGFYHVSTRARRAKVYTLSYQPRAGLCVINTRVILQEGF